MAEGLVAGNLNANGNLTKMNEEIQYIFNPLDSIRQDARGMVLIPNATLI